MKTLESLLLGDEDAKNLPKLNDLEINKPTYAAFGVSIPLSAFTSLVVSNFLDHPSLTALAADGAGFLSYQLVFYSAFRHLNKDGYTVEGKVKDKLVLYDLITKIVPASGSVGYFYHAGRDLVQTGLDTFTSIGSITSSLIADASLVYPFVFARNKLLQLGYYIVTNTKEFKNKTIGYSRTLREKLGIKLLK